MYRTTILIMALSVCILSDTQAQPKAEGDVMEKAGALIISVISKEVSDKTFKLRYKVRNGSECDIWICEAISTWGFEAYLAEDGQTLLIRRRLDVPIYSFRNQPFGRYIRLRAGESRRECLMLPFPIHLRGVFSNGTPTTDIVYAKRVVLEVGYYAEGLPGMVRGILEEAEKINSESADSDLALIKKNIKGLLYFNEANEGLRYRDEQILIPYSQQALKGEHVLQAMVDGLRIPYIGIPQRPKLAPPDLSHCTRIEIQFQPSMLQYFFPNTSVRSILNAAETEYLHSLKAITVNDQGYIKDFSRELSKGFPGGISTERSKAHVICYRDGKRLMSFSVYDDSSILSQEKQLFTFRKGLSKGLRSLRILTPQIQPFELRVQCVANLKDLWHRLCLYYKTEKKRPKDSSGKSKIVYPAPTKWCDAMVLACRTIGMLDDNIIRPFICPGVDDGKRHLVNSHFTMNPNCKVNSPADTVLLFETKAGWNKHGGPELFTFDNHEPKGGCVLLNDGTVKFIRTKEELRKLRW